MTAAVQIEGAGTSDAALQQEAMVLARLLDGQPGLAVAHPEAGTPAPGQRGALLQIGKLMLDVLVPGGVDALIQGLKLYLARSPEFSIAITGDSGARIEVTGKDLAPERIVETAERLRALLAPRS